MLLEPSTGAWLLLSVCTVLVSGFLLYAYRSDFKQKVPLFYSWIGAIALFGGALAFLLPIALNSGFGKDDDGRVLRQLILYTTGGVLGVITLGETHRKNNQEKEKNENDHIRQVHAERRSRYAKAVEQLADEKAAVRLGGIYTLVGLVDEWIVNDSKEKGGVNPQHEGQTIINNLCAYIRTPFSLANSHHILDKDNPTEEEIEEYGSKNFTKHKLKFHEEKDTRQAILHEIKLRLNSGYTMDEENEEIPLEGPWSKFTYNFSKAFFFYPFDLSGSFFSQSVISKETVFANKFNVSGSIFKGETNFSNARFVYQDSSKTFNFKGVRFKEISRFNGAIFESTADFRGVHAESEIEFSRCHLKQGAWFLGSKFKDAYFISTKFSENWHLNPYSDVSFNGVEFKGATTTFRGAEFYSSSSFESAIFEGNLDLVNTRFGYYTKFTKAIFKENIYLAETIFPKTRKTDFTDALFRDSIYYTWDSILPLAPMMNPLGVIFYTVKDESNKKNQERNSISASRCSNIQSRPSKFLG